MHFLHDSGPLIISHVYKRFACAHLRCLLLFPAVPDADTLWFPTHSGPDDTSIYVDMNTRIQILDNMMDLPTADKEQSAAFIVSSTSGFSSCLLSSRARGGVRPSGR